MADEKKQDKIEREDILKALVETLMKGGSNQQSGIDMNALMTIITSLMRGGEGEKKVWKEEVWMHLSRYYLCNRHSRNLAHLTI